MAGFLVTEAQEMMAYSIEIWLRSPKYVVYPLSVTRVSSPNRSWSHWAFVQYYLGGYIYEGHVVMIGLYLAVGYADTSFAC